MSGNIVPLSPLIVFDCQTALSQRFAARIIRGPGEAAFHPPLSRGQVLPLANPRGMERLEAHQSCVIRAAFWTARAPLGAPLAAFFLAMPGPRFRLAASPCLR